MTGEVSLHALMAPRARVVFLFFIQMLCLPIMVHGQFGEDALIKPSCLNLGGTSFQLLYQGVASNNIQSAVLLSATGVRGKALMMLYPGRTKGTAFLEHEKYLFEISRERTNITQLFEPPGGCVDHTLPVNDPPLDTGGIRLAAVEVPSGDGQPISIDVMVLYTPAARDAAGGVSNMVDKINLAVAEANQAYIDSGVNVHLNLVYSGLVSYTEGASLSADLSSLYRMDQAITLRRQYGADMVCMFVQSHDPYYAGIAYVLTGAGTDAFSVVDARYANGYYVFAHELGHNFGCLHDHENAGNGVGAFSYSYGYRFNVGGNTYRTIMAYAPGYRLGYFSTPLKTYLGVPVGTATEDNARTINQRAAFIASLQGPPTNTLAIAYNGTGSVLYNGTALSGNSITVLRGQTISQLGNRLLKDLGSAPYNDIGVVRKGDSCAI